MKQESCIFTVLRLTEFGMRGGRDISHLDNHTPDCNKEKYLSPRIFLFSSRSRA